MIDLIASLYFEIGAGYVRDLGPVPQEITAKLGPSAYRKYDFNRVANPRGHVAVGIEHDMGQVSVSLSLRHESWIGSVADSGEESAWVNVRIKPWRK